MRNTRNHERGERNVTAMPETPANMLRLTQAEEEQKMDYIEAMKCEWCGDKSRDPQIVFLVKADPRYDDGEDWFACDGCFAEFGLERR